MVRSLRLAPGQTPEPARTPADSMLRTRRRDVGPGTQNAAKTRSGASLGTGRAQVPIVRRHRQSVALTRMAVAPKAFIRPFRVMRATCRQSHGTVALTPGVGTKPRRTTVTSLKPASSNSATSWAGSRSGTPQEARITRNIHQSLAWVL